MNELERKIVLYSKAYYDEEPIVSDDYFNDLIEQLRKEYPDSSCLTTGWGYRPNSDHLEKRIHTFHVSSLDKVQVSAILDNEYSYSSSSFVIAPKLDGASAVAYYDKGKLLYVLSRGDGEKGLDITNNIGRSIPLEISEKGKIEVRGEIVMTYNSFKLVSGSHPRNKASGLSQSKHSSFSELQHLRFIAYDIPKTHINNKAEEFRVLNSLGFEICRYYEYSSWNEFKVDLTNESKFSLEKSECSKVLDLRDKIDGEDVNGSVPIDGLVIYDLHDKLLTKAFKFDTPEIETDVTDIELRLTRTGRIVPRLHVKETKFEGATVNYATANNMIWLREMGIGVGSKILLTRANEIIPKVTNVVTKVDYTLPINCPCCDSILEEIGRDLKCVNPKCDSKLTIIYYSLLNWASVLGTGGTTLHKLIDFYDLNSIDSIKQWSLEYNKTEIEELVGVAQEKLVSQLANNLKTKTIEFNEILRICNLEKLGNSYSKAIDKSIPSLKDLNSFIINNYPNKEWEMLCNKPAWISLVTHFSRVVNLYNFFSEERVILMDKISKTGLKLVITGKISVSKKNFYLEASEFGIIESDVKNADVCISVKSDSSKTKQAAKRGIPIFSESDFRKEYFNKEE